MAEIILKPFEQNDFARLISWIRSPEFLLQWAGPIFTYPLDKTQLLVYFKGSQDNPPARMIYKAIHVQSNAVVGHIELNDIDPRNRSAAVCRVLVGEAHLRSKGIGTEMVRRLLEIGFDQLGLHRIDLVVFDFNIPAIKCYEKVGLVKEGHLRDVRRIGNEYWSLYQMTILEHEWRGIKERLRACQKRS